MSPIHFIAFFPNVLFIYWFCEQFISKLFSLSLSLSSLLKARSCLMYLYPSPFPIPTSQIRWVIIRSGCNSYSRQMPLLIRTLGCLLAHLALWLVSSQLSRQWNRPCVRKDQTHWVIGVECLREKCSKNTSCQLVKAHR